VITNFALVEDLVGSIIGLEVTGNVTGALVDVLGRIVEIDQEVFTAPFR
jgi:hypothetical protein